MLNTLCSLLRDSTANTAETPKSVWFNQIIWFSKALHKQMNLFRLKFLRTSATLRDPSRVEPSRVETTVGDGLSLYHRTQSRWTRLECTSNRLAQHGRNIRHGKNFIITWIWFNRKAWVLCFNISTLRNYVKWIFPKLLFLCSCRSSSLFNTVPKNTRIYYKIILQIILHVSVPLHHLQGAYILLAKVIKY